MKVNTEGFGGVMSHTNICPTFVIRWPEQASLSWMRGKFCLKLAEWTISWFRYSTLGWWDVATHACTARDAARVRTYSHAEATFLVISAEFEYTAVCDFGVYLDSDIRTVPKE